MTDELEDQEECYLCGAAYAAEPNAGTFAPRPDTSFWFHDQCWIEWNALYKDSEPHVLNRPTTT